MYQIQKQDSKICVACEQDLQEQFKKTYRMLIWLQTSPSWHCLSSETRRFALAPMPDPASLVLMQHGLRIGIAQINGTVGDFPGNAKKILHGYRACMDQGADLVITPEMSLVGYPPRDLVHKSQFVPKCLQALDYLSEEIKHVPLLVGYVDHNTHTAPGRPFRNAAAWLESGKIIHKIYKTLLPTYDVFDELRYFEASEKCDVIHWQGYRLGITICEDIWTDDYLPRPLYDRDPIEEFKQQGIDLLLNLSASPYHIGKTHTRRELMARVSAELQAPVVYCNSGGGNDELIFDGPSMPLAELP